MPFLFENFWHRSMTCIPKVEFSHRVEKQLVLKFNACSLDMIKSTNS